MNAVGKGSGSSLAELGGKIKGFFVKKDTTAVGVDVGNSGVKIVEIEKIDGKLVLVNYAIAHSKEELIKPGTSGVVSDSAGPIVKKALSESDIKTEKVNVAVPSFSSLTTTIQMPQMPQSEIEQVVLREAPKYIPVQLSDVVYGWQIIEGLEKESPEGEGDEKALARKAKPLNVLMVAIMKDISNQYQKVFSSNGLTIDSLEIDSFSLERSLIGAKKGSFMILDIGHKVCNVIAVSNKNILLNRTIDVAGDRITKIISKSLNIDIKRAEKLKIEQGIEIDKDGTNTVSQVLGVLIAEIKRTNSALLENYPDVKIEKILLSGGGSKLKGLQEYITKEVGIPTALGNPLEEIAYPDGAEDAIGDHGPTLSIATGLAMLGFEEKN